MIDKVRKLELIQRSLGLRHKLKVHESMKPPETHEELSLMLLAKWEFEDELRAIEEILGELRNRNVQTKKKAIGAEDDSLPPGEREAAAEKRLQTKAARKKTKE